MKLSLVVPTHGRRDLLERTLASLARQEGAPPFEVLVIDDGADPGLGDFVAGLGLALDARVLHHEVNRGRSAARNTGIAAATGDVIVFLDGDMEVVPGFVAAHAALHGAPDTVVLGNIVTAAEIPRTSFVEYIDSRGVHKVGDSDDIPIRYFMTGNSSVAAVLLERVGGFDEEFDEYGGEDTEMGYRLGRAGGRFRHAAAAVSHHLALNSVSQMAERLHRYGERMLPILVRKVPEASRELRLDLVEPLRWGREPVGTLVRKAALSLLCHRRFWAPAARLGERLPRWLPVPLFFDLIRATAYLDGYRNATRGSS